jgi:hypothetical protein
MPGSTREASEARARQAEASEWADACRSALSECQKGLAEPERELSEAKEKVAKAVEAVIASQATATITKCENAMAAFALAHSTLFAVQRALPDHSELHEMCERVLRRSPYHRVENNPVFQTWERVRERLMLDAEAELPK